MSSNAPGPRPRQVTVGGWVIAVASAMLVISVFDSMTNLHSVDTRDMLTRALTSGSARDLGISVADALSILRIALFVAGFAAAVTGVLGIFVLQRHTPARVVLTVAAVPVVLTAPFSGGFLGLVIGLGTAMLWSRPARDWFAGRSPARRELAGTAAERPAAGAPVSRTWSPPRPPSAPAEPAPDAPPPTFGWGQAAGPESWPPPSPFTAGSDTSPPTQVRIACLLTWIFSSLTAVLYLIIGVALLVDRTAMLDLLRDNPTVRDSKLSEDELVAVIVAVSAVVVLWCLSACVLAYLTWRRHAWAWIVLLVGVGIALVVELVGFPFTLLHLIAAAATLRLLLASRTRAWFRAASGPGDPPPPGDWPPPGQHVDPSAGPDKPPVW